MWIFLGILLFLAVLITVILMLPIYVIIKTDQNGELIIRYRFLFKTYGENPDPNNKIVKTLKEASGITQIEKNTIQTDLKKLGFLENLSDTVSLLATLIKGVVDLLHYATAKVFKLNIICAEEDAAQTAISYGKCYAIVSPIISLVNSIVKIKKSNFNVNISCDYTGQNKTFQFETVLVIRLFRALSAFFKLAYKQAVRLNKKAQPK